MSLIVEDGTAKVDSESYCSVASADAYHAARSNATWGDLDPDVKEAALRSATDYITQTYSGRWSGDRRTTTQALDWPRLNSPILDSPLTNFRPSNSVPGELVKATAELAYRASSAPLTADLTRETSSETVDAISVSYVAGGARQTQYAAVEGWLRVLLKYGSMDAVQVVRA